MGYPEGAIPRRWVSKGVQVASGDLKMQHILKHLTELTGERQQPFGTRLCLQSLVCYTLVPADAEKGLRANTDGKHLFCGRRMRRWAWQLTVSAHPAQACRGTNGVRSPSCSSDAFFKNYSYVKRAGTVQPSLFLPKFPLHFLASCRKYRIFKTFC